MKKSIILFLFTVFASINIANAQQNFSITFVKDKIEYTLDDANDVVIPIDIQSVNTKSTEWNNCNMTIDILGNQATTLLTNEYSTNFIKIPLLNLNLTSVNTYYLRVNKTALINDSKKIMLQINVRDKSGNSLNETNSGNIKIIEIVIKKKSSTLATDDNISLKAYFEIKNDFIIEDVIKVDSKDNILTVSGYKNNDFIKKNLKLGMGEVFAVNKWSWIKNRIHWIPLPLSLTTIPIKVRPAMNSNGLDISSNATASITNIGFNLDLGKYQMDRYFATGNKSTHKFSVGFWAGPSVEELDETNTNINFTEVVKSKQLFISTGITINYSYNDISFVFVPAGWDLGTSTIGKNWIYNGKRWWGFGIGISPKIFSTVLNK